jgi:DNA transformation protein
MDREFLAELFAPFGPVTIRRMFSGFGISADGITFALVIRDTIYLRSDLHTVARFESEGSAPFQYNTRTKTVTVATYWQLPDRLLDDPDELAEWARAALAAAERAALAKRSKARAPKRAAKTDAAKKPAAKNSAKTPRRVVGKAATPAKRAPRKRG